MHLRLTSNSRKASFNSFISGELRAFRAFGLLSVTIPTRPFFSVRTYSYFDFAPKSRDWGIVVLDRHVNHTFCYITHQRQYPLALKALVVRAARAARVARRDPLTLTLTWACRAAVVAVCENILQSYIIATLDQAEDACR